MAFKPQISIITVCFNSEKFIEETINSVLSQDYENLQYIIIDGGSNDKTMDIVQKYKSQISTIVSEPDKGISDAFNKGIRYAEGDLIGIVNSDDILLPNALKKLAEHYEQGKYDIYRGNLIIWNSESGNKYKEIPSMSFSTTPVFISVAHESSFVTSEAYKKYGLYDINLHYTMDLDFFIRAYKKGAIFKQINEDFTMFRIGGATSTSMWKKQKDYIKMSKNNNASSLHAYSYYTVLLLIDICKRILDMVNPDLKRKIRLCKNKK